MKKLLLLTASSLVLAACSSPERAPVTPPQEWTSTNAVEKADPETLHGWWKNFNDNALNQLVDHALRGSPDRKIAESRVLEARGLRKSARSALFPQIGISGNAGRQKNVQSNFQTGNFYDAGFDASYELDLFGRNINTSSAANSTFKATEAEYQNVSLSLVAEVARNYIEFRAAQKQVAIAEKNLDSQQKTLDLVRQQKELGEAPQLDLERAEGLVNTTKSAIPEFQRQADNARLRLSVLTGEMPEVMAPLLLNSESAVIADIKPVLLTPAQIIALRPDVKAAQYNLESQTSLTKAEIANIFPTITLGGFFGVADAVLIDPTKIWSATANAAVSLLDFGRIQGGIDSARARETQAFELWRKTVIQAVTDVETALTDTSHINERLTTLRQASANAENSLTLSQQLYKEGEISFLDVLDAQRTLNNANAEVVSAEEAHSESLIALYKSLGVY